MKIEFYAVTCKNSLHAKICHSPNFHAALYQLKDILYTVDNDLF